MKKKFIKNILFLTISSLFISTNVLAEEKKTNDWKIEPGGYIRFDSYFDTRQSVSVREGLFMSYPAPIKLDDNGVDQNKNSNINFVSFFSRGFIKVKAPDALGAKISGLLEADFFGHLNPTISNFRLRNSFMKLDWQSFDLLLGQDWSPLFTKEVSPGTVSVGAGAPIQPFGRLPQMKLTYKPVEKLKFIGAAAMQRDAFRESGGAELQQQSGIPGLHLHSVYGDEKFKFGLGSFLRTTRPNSVANRMYSGALTAYTKFEPIKNLSFKTKVIYGNDMTDHLMLGGFVETKEKEFIPLGNLSSWLDINYKLNKNFSFGLYTGYTSNLGANKEVELEKFNARNPEIAYVLKIMPRIIFQENKFRVALELDSSHAMYTKEFDNKLKPKVTENDKLIDIFRINLSTYLFF